MKRVITLSILILAGCQITVAKLPDPVDPQILETLKNYEQTLSVLVEDYKKRNEPKKVEEKK
jgi:uncharacterized lipoprotein YajG